MGLDDLKPLVEILLHGLVVDQVLLELLRELRAEHLQVLDLLGCFASYLQDLLVDVAAQEMCSLC